jgi:acyl-coenzyme A thioesterase PaaI-like protein
MAFVEAKLYDERDRVCCMGSGTFKYFKDLPSKRTGREGREEK